MNRRVQSTLLLLATIPLGLAIRYGPLHLPWLLYKYGGSALWAVALYWFLSALLPRLRPLALAALSIAVATLVELSRLTHTGPVFSAIDAFRLTLPGRILLGRFFSAKNIAAYVLAIALTALLDRRPSPDNRA